MQFPRNLHPGTAVFFRLNPFCKTEGKLDFGECSALFTENPISPNSKFERMKITVTILVLLLLASNAYAQSHLPDFQVPKSFETKNTQLGATYLETYPVADPHQILTAESRSQLVQLFVAAARFDQKHANQFYPIRVSAPIVQLLLTQFPKLKSLMKEGDNILMLSDVEKFFEK